MELGHLLGTIICGAEGLSYPLDCIVPVTALYLIMHVIADSLQEHAALLDTVFGG